VKGTAMNGGVKVAIWAFGSAERPMDVDAEEIIPVHGRTPLWQKQSAPSTRDRPNVTVPSVIWLGMLDLVLNELGKGASAMGKSCLSGGPRVFHLRRHFTKRNVMAFRHEHWIITMANIAAWRPNQRTLALANKEHVAAIGMGK